jgi:hypothetical protein
MLIDITINGKPAKVRVCDYCRATCIPSGRYCSGRCAGQDRERRERMAQESERDRQLFELRAWAAERGYTMPVDVAGE